LDFEKANIAMPQTGENIHKRKDGCYEARYIAKHDKNGRVIYKSVYGYSKAEMRKKTESAYRAVCEGGL